MDINNKYTKGAVAIACAMSGVLLGWHALSADLSLPRRIVEAAGAAFLFLSGAAGGYEVYREAGRDALANAMAEKAVAELVAERAQRVSQYTEYTDCPPIMTQLTE